MVPEALMQKENLAEVAQRLVAPGKGILAADESPPTIGKRLASIGVESTAETRRAYRELLFTTPEIEKFISGVILQDETTQQTTAGGILFPVFLKQRGILPGIKVDQSLQNFGDVNLGEKSTRGLEGLEKRLADYAVAGLFFTKARAVYLIGAQTPTRKLIEQNASYFKKYALEAQKAGLLPIVEPEVLLDGNHTIEDCHRVSLEVLKAVFDQLKAGGVDLSGMLLKASMVLPGKDSLVQVSDEEIARVTVEVLNLTVPREVPGILFLSGGQTPEQATSRLNWMNRLFGKEVPWQLGFSFSRALQNEPLHAWKGEPENLETAQEIFLRRAKLVSLARSGQYAPEME